MAFYCLHIQREAANCCDKLNPIKEYTYISSIGTKGQIDINKAILSTNNDWTFYLPFHQEEDLGIWASSLLGTALVAPDWHLSC